MNKSFNLGQETETIVIESGRMGINLWRWVKTHVAELLCTFFIGAISLNMLTVISRKSITIDETVMIPAAYYHLAAGNFQLVDDHPPLSKILAAVPLLFIQPKELQLEEVNVEPNTPEAEWAYDSRFWLDNRSEFNAISFWSRVPMIALTATLGVLIFVFTRDLFGPRAAVLAVALFSLEPTMLAHGRVVQTDVPAAFGLLLVCFALYRYLRERSRRKSVLLGLACGVALLSKFSTLIIAPLLLIVFVVLLWQTPESRKRQSLMIHAVIVTLVTILVIQAAYFFQSRSLDGSDISWINFAFPTHPVLIEKSVRALSYILPTDFVIGAFWQLWHSKQGHPASLLGMYRQNGWWYYFPVAFSLKTSLPFLFTSISAIAWATYEVVRKRNRSILILLIPFAIYTVFLMMSPINIGIRYYLPAYGFLFIMGGALLDRALRVKKPKLLGTALVTLLLGWCAIEAVRSYPNYMSYMNQLAFSHPKWWYLSDSNLEWGDDIKDLADYLHARGETKIRSAVLGGFLILPFYDIENFDLNGPISEAEFPSTRYIAIGASFLNGSTVPGRAVDGTNQSNEKRVNRFAKYRNRSPEAVFGDSIYLYRLQD